jgi:uroporphyrinogen-III synthase
MYIIGHWSGKVLAREITTALDCNDLSEKPPRILITRSPHQASDLADRLRALGAEPILIPTIDTVDPTTFAPLDAALTRLASPDQSARFHWLLFTSANAVEAFHRRQALSTLYPLPSTLCSIAAIGPATARALEAIGLTPNLIPPQAVAESLAEALLPHALQADGTPTRFLLIRAEEAREHLPETLRAAGADVTIAPAYRTVIPAGSIDAIRELFKQSKTHPDAITFTSSSTARNLFALLEAAGITLPKPEEIVILSKAKDLLLEGADHPRSPIIASIGPITSATLRDLGHPPHIEAPEATVTSLAENLVKYLHFKKSL